MMTSMTILTTGTVSRYQTCRSKRWLLVISVSDIEIHGAECFSLCFNPQLIIALKPVDTDSPELHCGNEVEQ